MIGEEHSGFNSEISSRKFPVPGSPVRLIPFHPNINPDSLDVIYIKI